MVFRKGNIPWNKNLTKETDERVKKTSKTLSKNRRGENNPMWGRQHTKETKEITRLTHLGKPKSEKHKIKLSKFRKDKTYEEIYGSKERAEKIKKKISVNHADVSGDKNPAKRPEVLEKIKLARAKQKTNFTSSQEVKIQNFLKLLNIEFFTYQYIKIEHGYQCDILIPSINLIIECDGDFIHCNPIKYPSTFVRYPSAKKVMTAQEIWDRDKIRTKELIEKGFKVLRLWEFEINKMSINKFKEKIENIK